MSAPYYPGLFNDVFGPIMQPGSSSHTAGPCRLGFLAHHLLGGTPRHIRVVLDPAGSFSGTFGLMAEDSAMIAGALGMLPDDPRLFQARALANDAGVSVTFERDAIMESSHPNAVKFLLTDETGRVVSLVGDSTGGGMVEVRSLEGFPVRVRGDTYLVVVRDPEASLSEDEIETALSGLAGVVSWTTIVEPELGALHVASVTESLDLSDVERVFSDLQVAALPPVLPVLSVPERGPQLFDTVTRWREVARQRGVDLWEAAVLYEMVASGWPRERVISAMEAVAAAMHRQTRAAYEEAVDVPETPFRPNMAAQWAAHESSGKKLTDDLTASILRWAYGAGAGIPGVSTVPGPMGSGGGYIYGALSAVKEAHGFSDHDLLRGLFVAGGVGVIAFTRTEPTGEAIGCTGECGVCGAMAAAGIVEMAGGTPEQVEDAASLSLQAAIGMPCDPIPGGLSQPCRSRIISAVCMSVVFADLALAGRSGVLPFHEVLDVADSVGRSLSADLLCTSRGGLAATPTGLARAEAYRRWVQEMETATAPRPPGNLI